MIDPAVLSTAALSDALRLWLRSRRESPEVQASALTYEIAALVAKHSDTVSNAYAKLDALTQMMKAQIQQLGVGVEHP